MSIRLLVILLWVWCGSSVSAAPVKIIFDTDMGNDVDDALALGVIHALQSRGMCELLAVTVTKDHPLSAPFVDVINTFYGRGDVPIGAVRQGPTREAGRFNGLAAERDDSGQYVFAHDLTDGSAAPSATSLLRQVLAKQAARSVVLIQVGFSTNLARLLETTPDSVSSLSGRDLVADRVIRLSLMGGAFRPIDGQPGYREFNIVRDVPSAQKLVREWPTPIVFSGFEIGRAILYPAESIQLDYSYVARHPLAEAYLLYQPPPHNRPTWDLTSVLFAVLPERGYFSLSGRGRVEVANDGSTRFHPDLQGTHQYLVVTPQQIVRARQAMVQLSSQPPSGLPVLRER